MAEGCRREEEHAGSSEKTKDGAGRGEAKQRIMAGLEVQIWRVRNESKKQQSKNLREPKILLSAGNGWRFSSFMLV